MDTVEIFQRLAVALAIGLLIGLERGWKERDEKEGDRSAGLRTHALSGLLGGIWGLIGGGEAAGMIALGIAFAVFSAVVATYRLREIRAEGSFGATTVVAAMLAFSLGAYATAGDYQAAAAAGVATTALLALKRALHDWLERLTWIELRSALALLAMTFILLPLLPNRSVTQLAGLNPYEIWLMTVLIAAISFAGYVAVKVAGNEKGVVLTGIAAGLVSSTAVTMTLAGRARERPEMASLFTAGALLAGTTMMLRVLAVVALINIEVLRPLLPPLISAAAVSAGAAFLLMRRQRPVGEESQPIALKNPFELSTVLKFGALLAVIMLLTRFASDVAGGQGLLALAAISGLADVDALTLATARQAGGAITTELAVRAILLVVAVNTLAKAALAWSAGGRRPGLPMLLAALLAIAAGAGALALDSAMSAAHAS